MSMSSVTVRVDGDTKREATAIVEDFGLDLSSATRMFYKQIVREHRIPINLSYDDVPNAQTAEAIVQGRKILEADIGQFESPEELSNALGI